MSTDWQESLHADRRRAHAAWVSRGGDGDGRLVLEGKDLSKANLTGVLFSRARFTRCSFSTPSALALRACGPTSLATMRLRNVAVYGITKSSCPLLMLCHRGIGADGATTTLAQGAVLGFSLPVETRYVSDRCPPVSSAPTWVR